MATVTKNPTLVSSAQQLPNLPTRCIEPTENSTAAKGPAVENVFEPKGSRTKKKNRSQDVVIQDQADKPVDVFHICISQVRAQLRVVEPRPVLLTFEFDSYWHAETDVYSRDVKPVWRFNNDSIQGVGDFNAVRDNGDTVQTDRRAPVTTNHHTSLYSSEARFVYKTEFGYKLHRKFMIVRLAERSPYGDVEWGSAAISLDSIARGCEHLSLSILATDGITCYGTVYCNVAMINVQNIRIHLTDLYLSEYPEAYTYDVKLICLDLGVRPFDNDTNICTEKRSDAEPRFSAQPVLFRDASLRELLISTAMGGPSLKIFFSVRRQVARDRTEEIGVGALPIRMLFAKVAEGWMDLPTKFKVPLSGLKGVVRGKVLLRNIPQFCQLAGADLYNVDDAIMPVDVDLNSRKLLTWLKLPRSMECRRVIMTPAGCATDSDAVQHPKPSFVESASVGRRCIEKGAGRPVEEAIKSNAVPRSGSPSVEPISEEGSESSSGYGPKEIIGACVRESRVSSDPTDPKMGRKSDNCAHSFEKGSSGFQGQRDCGDNGKGLCNYSGTLDQTDVAHLATPGIRDERPQIEMNEDSNLVSWEVGVGSEKNRGPGRAGDHDRADIRYGGGKSGKSFGSCGTADGTIEIGSAVLSHTSDDGFGGSGCGGDATGGSSHGSGVNLNRECEGQRCGNGTVVIDCEKEVLSGGEADRIGGKERMSVGAAGDTVGDGDRNEREDYDEDDWVAVHHGPSRQYYFVHRFTQESLWLPPDWARGEDESGYQYFIDHGSKRTQRAFPIVEARAYRESVFAG